MTDKEAIKILRTVVGCCSNDIEYIGREKLISALPKHGYWIRHKTPNNIDFGFVCSECGEWSGRHGKFCHNCGAKMDEE